jgi:hypothetical protein
MIEITNIEETAPRAISKARQVKPYVTKLSENQYKVVPRAYPKQKRVVTFRQVGARRYAECRDFHTNEICPAAIFGNVCYHAAAAHLRLESNRRRQSREVAAPVVKGAPAQPARTLPSWYNAPKINGIRI